MASTTKNHGNGTSSAASGLHSGQLDRSNRSTTNELRTLLDQVPDPRLRSRIVDAIAQLKKRTKFGLVFEEHLPELLPIFRAKIRKGAQVAQKLEDIRHTFVVKRIANRVATCEPHDSPGTTVDIAIDALTVVKQFGEPIFPSLRHIDSVVSTPTGVHNLLLEADNYHGLQLLNWLYKGKIDCIYIDPPYNTGAKDWKYNNDFVDKKDDYQHSKWLSMMKRRLTLSCRLLAPDGILCVTVDDYEMHHLRCLFEDALKDLTILGVVPIKNNPAGRTTTAGFSICHEYAIFFGRPNAIVNRLGRTVKQKARYKEKDDVSYFEWTNFRKHGGKDTYRKTRPRQFYPIYVEDKTIRIPAMQYNDAARQWIILEEAKPTEQVLYPINDIGEERIWDFGVDTARKNIAHLLVKNDTDGQTAIYRKWRMPQEGLLPQTWWDKSLYSAAEYGTNVLADIFREKHRFPFPKSIYAVRDCLQIMCAHNQHARILDFFAGSGTTLHAAAMLNYQDSGNRQTILITNNAVSAEEDLDMRTAGHLPGDPEWESRGICRSVTFPRCKAIITGQRSDGTVLDEEYITGQFDRKEVERHWRDLAFADLKTLNADAKAPRLLARRGLAKALGLPVSRVGDSIDWIADKKRGIAVLLQPNKAAAFAEALQPDNQSYDTIYLPTSGKEELDALRHVVSEQWEPLIRDIDVKRPMSAGFEENLDYFRLDFLDKSEVETGSKLADILPLLWMMAGAIGPRPTCKGNEEMLFPPDCPFGILVEAYAIRRFVDRAASRPDLRWVFLVTNSDETFSRLSSRIPGHVPIMQRIHLYRNYLENFVINVDRSS